MSDTERIYVIQYRPVGCVKIGRSTNERTLLKRVVEILGGLPTTDADVLFVLERAKGAEKVLHHRFGECRERGEWFRTDDRLHEWLVAHLSEEHQTVADGKVVTLTGREGLVGVAPEPHRPTSGELRAKIRQLLMNAADSPDEDTRNAVVQAHLDRALVPRNRAETS